MTDATAPTAHVVIHDCCRCGVTFNAPNAYPPPGWVWRGSQLFCDDCACATDAPLVTPAPQPAPKITPVVHPMQAEYDRLVAEPRYQAQRLATGWAVTHQLPPRLTVNGGMNISLRIPVIFASGWLTDEGQCALIEHVAKLLEKHEMRAPVQEAA